MNELRTIVIWASFGALLGAACSSNNATTSTVANSPGGSGEVVGNGGTTSTGGGGGALGNGGTTAALVNSTGGSGGVLGTGGTTTAPSDAGNPNSGADSSASVEAPGIEGIYNDDGYFVDRITADTWYVDVSIFHIKVVNNVDMFLIAQNDASNAYYYSKWSRFDWAWDGNNVLNYCQTAYDAPTEQQALDTARANASDFNNGCDGFSWSTLTPIQNTDAGDAAP